MLVDVLRRIVPCWQKSHRDEVLCRTFLHLNTRSLATLMLLWENRAMELKTTFESNCPLSRRQFVYGLCAGAAVLGSPALLKASAQVVPIKLEPHHRIIFENGFMRVFEIVIDPGDITLFHEHAHDFA